METTLTVEMTDEQKREKVTLIESNIKNLRDVDIFVNLYGRTRKFFLCSDEFINSAYDYLVRKGAIK